MIKKICMILIITLFISGCSEKSKNINYTLENNGYSKKELTSLISYTKEPFNFSIAKDNSGIVITYEENDLTITTNSKNHEKYSSFSCEYDFSVNKATDECSEKEIEQIKKAKSKIEQELKSLNLKWENLK